jgi:hypothetical protein
MKKSAFILILLLILPLASAVEFSINEEFKQGETLIGKISGNFIEPVLRENIIFRRGHVKVPMEYDLNKINDEYYLYAVLPETQSNYSVSIEEVSYKQGTQVLDDAIIRNFTITEETVPFNVNPGVILTKDFFSLNIQNLAGSSITVETTTNVETKSIIIKSGDTEKIEFTIEDFVEPTLESITLASNNFSYEIPVSVFLNTSSRPTNKEMRFDPGFLNFTMATNTSQTKVLYLYNLGNTDLRNIELSISGEIAPYVNLSQDKINKLEGGSSVRIDLFAISDEDERSLEGQLRADADGFYAYSALSTNFIKDFVPAGGAGAEEGEPETLDDSCENLGGSFCADEEECKDNDVAYATDGICCMTSCKTQKKSSAGKYLGWILVLAAIAGAIWFYVTKYRKTEASTPELEKIAKPNLDKFEKSQPAPKGSVKK